MKPSSLTIAAVIPAYNAAPFIEQTLSAVVGQRRIPDEVFVVDDGSTDQTVALAEQWARAHSFTIGIIRQTNQGPSAARNAGILAASSDLIATVDADDIVLDNHLEILESGFHEWPDMALCFADAESFHGEEIIRSSFLAGSSLVQLPYQRMESGLHLIKCSAYRGIVRGSAIPTSATLYRRQAALDVGLYDSSFPRCNDREFLLRMSRHGSFGYFPIVVERIRRHTANLTHARHQALHLEQQIHVLRKMLASRTILQLSESEIKSTQLALEQTHKTLCYAKATTDGFSEYCRYVIKCLRRPDRPSMLVLTRNLARSIFLAISGHDTTGDFRSEMGSNCQ